MTGDLTVGVEIEPFCRIHLREVTQRGHPELALPQTDE
jgi:hypothetical protein